MRIGKTQEARIKQQVSLNFRQFSLISKQISKALYYNKRVLQTKNRM